MQSLHSGSSACVKFKAQILDAKFAFWVFCLPKFKAQTLDAKFAFWVFCLPEIQGPNRGCKVCILGLLPAQNPRPKPWMQSLHSGSSACLKIQGPNLGCKVCILGLQACLKFKAQTLDAKLQSWSSACLKFKAQTLEATFTFWTFCLPETQGPNLGCKVCILGLLPA